MLTINKHRSIMLSVLKSIYEDSLLGPILGFKGGTLLYTQYNLPRFSTDLDFDLIDANKEQLVFERLGKIAKKFGSVEELIIKKYTIFCMINYEKGEQNLKIEIHRTNLGNRFENKNYLGIAVLSMVKEDIFANKLIALTNRKLPANRDIFDTWFMLKNNWDINWDIVESRSLLTKDKYIKTCIKLLENWPVDNILERMGELLDNKTKDWVKKNLIKDAIFLLRLQQNIFIKSQV